MKKPHKVIIKFEDSEATTVTTSFETEKEAAAFIHGVSIANQIDGMNGFTYETKNTSKKK